jgi:hypothetical protein
MPCSRHLRLDHLPPDTFAAVRSRSRLRPPHATARAARIASRARGRDCAVTPAPRRARQFVLGTRRCVLAYVGDFVPCRARGARHREWHSRPPPSGHCTHSCTELVNDQATRLRRKSSGPSHAAPDAVEVEVRAALERSSAGSSAAVFATYGGDVRCPVMTQPPRGGLFGCAAGRKRLHEFR